MNFREKFVELLKNNREHYLATYITEHRKSYEEYTADHLIANGVTVQECGHWVSYESDEPYGYTHDKEWYRCSKCEKDTYGRCSEDEWYSAPILSAYCPHCGAKMMPQPPKGE